MFCLPWSNRTGGSFLLQHFHSGTWYENSHVTRQQNWTLASKGLHTLASKGLLARKGLHVLKYWLSSFRQHLGLTPLDQAACQEMPTLSRVQRSNIIQTLPSLTWMSASWHRGRATFNCPVLRLADVTTETGPPGFFRPKTFGPLAEAGLDWAACQKMPTLCRVWNANTVQTLHSLAEISASWQRGWATFNCPALRLAYVTTGTCPLNFFVPDTGPHVKARLDWAFLLKCWVLQIPLRGLPYIYSRFWHGTARLSLSGD